MNDVLAFVQFIHPGIENLPAKGNKSDLIPWNHGNHRRKFLCAQGQYVSRGRLIEEELTFWGEWEPQSRITRITNPKEDGCSPHVIHRPALDLTEMVKDGKGRYRQNTDPFVFHEQFLFRCCQQRRKTGPTQLSHLLPGSVVLFGSRVNGLFAVDTVFVVGDYRDYCDELGGMDFDPGLKDYAEIVGIGLGMNEPGWKKDGSQMRLYYGASPVNPYEGMYSFVPCKPLKGNERGCARPTLTQPEMRDIYADCITDNLQQSFKLCPDATMKGNIAAWNRIRTLFAQKGYLEGVNFQCPRNSKL